VSFWRDAKVLNQKSAEEFPKCNRRSFDSVGRKKRTQLRSG
jgi:hypothetical protein